MEPREEVDSDKTNLTALLTSLSTDAVLRVILCLLC